MKSVSEKDLELHIDRAVRAMTPDRAEEIWNRPYREASGDEWYLDGSASAFRRRSRTAAVLGFAAVLFLAGFLVCFMKYIHAGTTVCLDLNPSVTLSLNAQGKVRSAKGVNPEGEALLAGLHPEGREIREAVRELVEAAGTEGYFPQDEGLILISVESRDAGTGEKLRYELGAFVQEILDEKGGGVFCQSLAVTDAERKLAEKQQITPGKASLVLTAAKAAALDADELAGLPLRELAETLYTRGVDLRDFADYLGRTYPPEQKAQAEAEAERAAEEEAREAAEAETARQTAEESARRAAEEAEAARQTSAESGFSGSGDGSGRTSSGVLRSGDEDDDDDEDDDAEDNDDDDDDGDDDDDEDD